jgi:ABC-type uncharacterized transport system permease subunit
MTNVLIAIGSTLGYASPLIYAALGGVISERSGVVNIGLEGMMVIGALVAATAGYYSGNPWLGFLAGGLAGAVIAFLHAVACVSLHADQTISGIALNFIGSGVALFLARLFFNGATQTLPVPQKMPKPLSGIFADTNSPFAVAFNQDIAVIFALVIVFVMWFVLYKTKWGLRIRACGEHPAAADSLAINVSLVRYVCVILSGFLAGLGGATMSLSVVSTFSPLLISGHGFIALAAVILGRWTPHGVLGACLLFGFSQVLVVLLGGGVVRVDTKILSTIPYIITILVLIIFRSSAAAPKAEGIPFKKGSR